MSGSETSNVQYLSTSICTTFFYHIGVLLKIIEIYETSDHPGTAYESLHIYGSTEQPIHSCSVGSR